ncbi:MAG: 4'-phosphopantetheinyl transferase family protein [Arcticibacter sp.]
MKLTFATEGRVEKQHQVPKHGSHPGEVHVWTHITGPGDAYVALAPQMLSQDELNKALKYHYERDRKVYLSGHVFIRKVLAHYSGLAPTDIQLTPVVNAKPRMTNAPFPLHFNISHCGTRILVAVGFDTDVGIDVEEVLDDFDMEGFSENNYHPNEINKLSRLSAVKQVEYFYTVWTRKESWLKLTGEGSNDRLRELDFSGENESLPNVDFNGDVHMFTWRESNEYLATLAATLPSKTIMHLSSDLIN